MIIESYIPYTEIKGAIIALLSLPAEIRPDCFSSDEVSKKVRIASRAELETCIEKNQGGFFLWAKRASYNISFYSKRIFSHITVFDEDFVEKLTEPDAVAILKAFVRGGSSFSFAANWDEYVHRNRYSSRQFGVSQLESWVGRDLRRYLPGIYWLTVLSKKHADIIAGIPSTLGAKVEQIDTEHWLIKAYDNPNDWKEHAPRIDEWLSHQPAFFSKNRILPILDAAPDIMSISNAASKWR